MYIHCLIVYTDMYAYIHYTMLIYYTLIYIRRYTTETEKSARRELTRQQVREEKKALLIHNINNMSAKEKLTYYANNDDYRLADNSSNK